MQPKQIPMLSGYSFTEQINIKVSAELKKKASILKGHGVDTAELFRRVIDSTIRDTIEKLGIEKAG